MEIQKADDVVIAEAAAWIARLQGSERTAAAEAGFREWLAADSSHARAFSRATDVWDVIPGVARFNPALRPAASVPRGKPRSLSWSLAAGAALGVIGGVVAFMQMRSSVYTTVAGQQQTIVLDDGSRLSLNTNSKVRVVYTPHERRLVLDRGEGMFEVEKDSSRPFVVQAGGQLIRALGTTFVVRKDTATVAVTLLDGKVSVSSASSIPSPANSGGGLGRGRDKQSVLLTPGDRATLRPNTAIALDHPKLETVTAWHRGEVIFDDTSLSDAISEINRYGGPHVVLSTPELARLRVSGVFETRNPAEFAQAMAQLHRLTVRRGDREIVLERPAVP